MNDHEHSNEEDRAYAFRHAGQARGGGGTSATSEEADQQAKDAQEEVERRIAETKHILEEHQLEDQKEAEENEGGLGGDASEAAA